MSTNTNIKSVVDAAIAESGVRLPYGAQPVVDKVVEALSVKAEEIADSLRVSAQGMGARSAAVEEALVNSGLVVPTPEPVNEAPASDEDRLGKIEQAVARLTALAERHLGSRF